ncbi:hypothetical protein SDC9_154120 [bioreactor metagenome]|uniref:Uncharacterized protein n=1 Tax=bioreactor metagenome TaxID=1076179 RepID=A0A645F2J0_9ZZZZ
MTVEPAWITLGQPNTKGKSELEKKFFPGYNRIVEFFFKDSILGSHGFRIDTVSMDNYIMEVVWATDFKEEYTIERRKIPVSATFAGQVWKSYHGIMKYYFSRGIAPTSSDGYSVTFRCVVEDFSLWTFFARNPLSHIKDLSTACNEIVKEVQENGKMANEEKHIKQIDKLLRKGNQNLKKKHPGERIQFL